MSKDNKQLNYRRIEIGEDIVLPGIPRRPIIDKIRDTLRLIENSLLNDDIFGIQLELQKPPGASFPGKDMLDARRFLMVVKVLKIVYFNLTSHQTITKRDLYYQDVDLFERKQRNSDTFIDILSYSLNTPSHKLGIIAAQKGLVFGEITILYDDDKEIIIERSKGATLIPPMIGFFSLKVGYNVKYILIVEKEAIFQRLCSRMGPECLLITGKGYPDRLTVSFTNKLGRFTSLPVFGIADSDPYGINILLQYKFGHQNLYEQVTQVSLLPKLEDTPTRNHFTAKNRVDHCVNLQYLGVFICEYTRGWLDLSSRDFVLARNLLQRIAEDVYLVEVIDTVNEYSQELDRDLSFSSSNSSSIGLSQASITSTFTELSEISPYPNNRVQLAGFSDSGSSVTNTMQELADKHTGSFKRELQRQMFFKKKCEMNVVGDQETLSDVLYHENIPNRGERNGICDYVKQKLMSAGY
ncbi:DNA topoisomerase (ATP-hydrolyzing) [Saccharomycopsis crataegensis]|uniref:DNA topoisomerase (ATP-hydrolyzing) n=1 Tax=Saccharomycopsis crataegensis TaxID=43959 RepID=A0AAV5QT15_9ASCO|nr:DNA topoisomerase (ATP-hydrolyzing) [Saccharomycopsis crataegensis]